MRRRKTVKEKELEYIVSKLKRDFESHNEYHRSKIDLNDLLKEITKQFGK